MLILILSLLPLCWASSDTDTTSGLDILWIILIGVSFIVIVGLIALASAWVSRPARRTVPKELASPLRPLIV